MLQKAHKDECLPQFTVIIGIKSYSLAGVHQFTKKIEGKNSINYGQME